MCLQTESLLQYTELLLLSAGKIINRFLYKTKSDGVKETAALLNVIHVSLLIKKLRHTPWCLAFPYVGGWG